MSTHNGIAHGLAEEEAMYQQKVIMPPYCVGVIGLH